MKVFFEALCDLHGEESQPRTAATRRMVRLILRELIDKRFPSAELRARVYCRLWVCTLRRVASTTSNVVNVQ